MKRSKLKVSVSSKKDDTLSKIADKAVRNQRFAKEQEREAERKDRYGRDFKNDASHPERGPNDIKWRTSTRLTISAANIPFGQALGLPMWQDMRGSLPDESSQLGQELVIPGIMALKLKITAGNCSDYNSPFNLAVRKSYSWIRHANSGSKNYDAVDLGMYYIAVGQALALLGWLKRLYTHAINASSTNRYIPRGIISANDVQYDDIILHLPNVLFLINWMSSVINSLAFPKFAYFDMCYRQFMHVYKDSESPKEQLYLFVPDGFGIYDPAYTTNGGGIDYTKSIANPSNWNYAQIDACVHAVMDVLLGDEDIGIISGDILKAYGEDRFKVEMVDVKEILEPMYSIEILEQIHNATVVGTKPLVGYEQDPGTTNTAPFAKSKWTTTSATTYTDADYRIPAGKTIFMDAFGKVPSPEEVVNCSILKSHLLFTSVASSTGIAVTPVGIDHDVLLLTGIYIIESATGSPTRVNLGATSEWPINLINRNGTPVHYEELLLTNFDWAPMLFIFEANNETLQAFGDVHNMTSLQEDVLERIHRASTLSLFNYESGNF